MSGNAKPNTLSNFIFQYADYVMIDISYLNAKELVEKFTSKVETSVDLSTGELKKISRWNGKRKVQNAYYIIPLDGLEIDICFSNLDNSGKIYLRGSLPKYYMKGKHNFTKFETYEIDKTYELLSEEIGFDPNKSSFIKIEYGFMYFSHDVEELVSNSVLELGRNNPIFYEGIQTKKVFRPSHYLLKHYNKSKQLSTFNIHKFLNYGKFEKLLLNTRKCKSYRLFKCSDILLKDIQQRLKKDVLKAWNATFIYDKNRDFKFQSEDYWRTEFEQKDKTKLKAIMAKNQSSKKPTFSN